MKKGSYRVIEYRASVIWETGIVINPKHRLKNTENMTFKLEPPTFVMYLLR